MNCERTDYRRPKVPYRARGHGVLAIQKRNTIVKEK
jgi:hypothetical protein